MSEISLADIADELAAYYAERLANAAHHDAQQHPGKRQDRPQEPKDPIIASGGATPSQGVRSE